MPKIEKNFGKNLVDTFCRKCHLNVLWFMTLFLPTDVEKNFADILNKDRSLSAGIAAIKTLLKVLESSRCKYNQYLAKTTANVSLILQTNT